MEQRFTIKAKYFSLYQAFRKEAEKVGWVYNEEFYEFREDKMNRSNCLFFSTHWSYRGWNPMFSFSNSDTNVFQLPEQWNDAIEHMAKVFEDGKPGVEVKEKLTISLKYLAAHHGVDVNDIVITS